MSFLSLITTFVLYEPWKKKLVLIEKKKISKAVSETLKGSIQQHFSNLTDTVYFNY